MEPRARATFIGIVVLTLALAGCAPAQVQEARDTPESNGGRGFGDTLADQRLRGRIMGEILNDDELLDRSNINVTVFNGIVLLTGEVPRREAGQRIARFAREQDDARHVHNELVVARLSSVMERSRDGFINRSATGRIRQLREPAGFDSRRVQTVTERRRIYLLGRVTREEADTITERVRRIGGVREVVRLFEYRD